MSEHVLNIQNAEKKWQFVFRFFDEHGAPSTASFREAYKTLSFMKKVSINFNIWAFLFGFIYFLVKGMVKPALTIFLVDVAAFVMRGFLPHSIGFGIGAAAAMIASMTANYTYYRHTVLGEKDFNPFKGIGGI